MSVITEQFLEAFESPKIIFQDFNTSEFDNIDNYLNLKSRQKITITQEEMDQIASNEDFWFYESDKECYDRIFNMSDITGGVDYSNITDAFGLSEYVAIHEKYIPYMPYLQYTKMNDIDILMNVYDTHSLSGISRRNEIIKEKINKNLKIKGYPEAKEKLPEFDFKIPTKVRYGKFINNTHKSDIMIPSFKDPVHITSVNIPYSNYVYQPLPISTYNWDIDDNKHIFGGYSVEEFENLFEDICTNGIQEPLFMRLDGKILSSIDDKTNLIIFIAKVLKLPSIPVNVYLTNEDIGINHLVKGMVYDKRGNIRIPDITSINKDLFPYIIISKEDEDIDFIDIQSKTQYSPYAYKIFNQNEGYIIRYLDLNSIENIDNEDIMKQHELMKEKEIESLNNEINIILDNINKDLSEKTKIDPVI